MCSFSLTLSRSVINTSHMLLRTVRRSPQTGVVNSGPQLLKNPYKFLYIIVFSTFFERRLIARLFMNTFNIGLNAGIMFIN